MSDYAFYFPSCLMCRVCGHVMVQESENVWKRGPAEQTGVMECRTTVCPDRGIKYKVRATLVPLERV